jgi:hypothetical protein
VVALVEETGGSTLLDVGSGSQGIARFLGPRWEVTAADVSFDDYGAHWDTASAGRAHRLEASVLDLPCEDASFDVVVCLDMLEHLDPGSRPQAVSELVRVTRRRLVLACPCGPAALDADRRLAAWYDRLGRSKPGWLVEHLENGFPEPGDLAELIGANGRARLLPNESLGTHLAIGRAEATPVVRLAAAAAAQVLEPGIQVRRGPGRRAAAACIRGLRGGDRAPGYRTIAVLDR